MELEDGQKAPNFTLTDYAEREVSLAQFRESWVVLYFYPKNNTPGCTMEGRDFSAHIEEFHHLKAVVMGISADSIKSHCAFRDKQNLRVILLSDPDKKVCELYGVLRNKTFFGKFINMIGRTTFLIDPRGTINKIWRSVTVEGHAQKVLDQINSAEAIKKIM